MEEELRAFEGNAERYSAGNARPLPESPLKGKTFYFLGSSVTLGSASGEESFADFIAARNGCACIKNAVSGTTLADTGETSYVRRLLSDARPVRPDVFVCQLSTNDAASAPLGDVSPSFDGRDFLKGTTIGAAEYIIYEARRRYACPVAFYSSPYFENERYAAAVSLMRKVAEKWKIRLIDLYSDEAFNAVSPEKRALYMHDEIHPLRAGYLEWWTPRFEAELVALCGFSGVCGFSGGH